MRYISRTLINMAPDTLVLPPPHLETRTVGAMYDFVLRLDMHTDALMTLDISKIKDRSAPVLISVAAEINHTLEDIFRNDWIGFLSYQIESVVSPSRYLLGAANSRSIKKDIREGIERCVATLRVLRKHIAQRIQEVERQSAGERQSFVGPDHIVLRNGTRLPNVDTQRVFVVHGHDDGTKEMVARFLSKIDLDPVILHEQPNRGRTVIEKFEAHSDVAFAVVLLTPDDVGHPINKPGEAKPRARQNVVLELGFFMSSLGRNRICVLYKSGVEVPSDYAGVLYHEIDSAGAWRFSLAREIKAAGVDIDLNKVV